MVVETRPLTACELGIGACSKRKDLAQHPQRGADGSRRGIRTEVLCLVLARPADDGEPGESVVDVQSDTDIRLVVPEKNVVARAVFILDDSDVKELEGDLPGILAQRELVLSKGYLNELKWDK